MTSGDAFQASKFMRWVIALLRADATVIAFLPPYDGDHATKAPRLITQGDGYAPANSGIAVSVEPVSTPLSRALHEFAVDFRVSLRNEATAPSPTTDWGHMVNQCLVAIERALVFNGQSEKEWGVLPSVYDIGIKRATVVATEPARLRDPDTRTFDGMIRVRFSARFSFDSEINTPIAPSPPPPPPPPPTPTPAVVTTAAFKPGSGGQIVVFTFDKDIDIDASLYIDFAGSQFVVRTGLSEEGVGTGTPYYGSVVSYGGAIAANKLEVTFSLPGVIPIYVFAEFVGYPIAIVDEDGLVINSSERFELV